jgi:hypothetical protein
VFPKISTATEDGGDMSDAIYFRKWAAQVARQAGEQPDPNEAQRLLSIAEYWVRLADAEEWTQDDKTDLHVARSQIVI